MVFGKTRQGFQRCVRINFGILMGVVVLHVLLALPPVSRILFGRILGLPPEIETPAILSFRATLPLLILFRLRDPYQIVLLNAAATGRAFAATLGRILSTLLLSGLFCALGLVGPVWAVACLTLPAGMELVLTRAFARPFMRRMEPSVEPPPSYLDLTVFAMTLSIGLLFLTLSGFMVGAFAARAPDPQRMLPVFYLALGIANPVAVGATRLQALTLTYYGQSARINRKLIVFTGLAGLALGLFPMLLAAPGLIHWYYAHLQKLPGADLGLIRSTSLVLVWLPLAAALRAYSEGKAAWARKPAVILAGQAVYLSIGATLAFLALHAGLPGNLLGAAAMIGANLTAAGIMALALRWERRGALPEPVPRDSAGIL